VYHGRPGDARVIADDYSAQRQDPGKSESAAARRESGAVRRVGVAAVNRWGRTKRSVQVVNGSAIVALGGK
jgi:hypothetical protein